VSAIRDNFMSEEERAAYCERKDIAEEHKENN